jgi:hypothetical protein
MISDSQSLDEEESEEQLLLLQRGRCWREEEITNNSGDGGRERGDLVSAAMSR